MNELILMKNDQIFTTSTAIAEGIRRDHKNVIGLIRENLKDLEDFGRVAFQTHPFKTDGGTQKREEALLNREQASLMMTYFRNNDIVKAFKKNLIKAFFDMAEKLRDFTPKKEPTVLELLEMGANSERQRLILVQKNLQLEHKIEKDRPDVEFSQFVKCLHGSITVAEAAKILGTGAKRLFKLLRAYGWVNEKNEPYQNVLDKKLLDFKIEKTRHKDYGLQEYTRTLVTAHGLFALQKMYRDEKYPLFAA